LFLHEVAHPGISFSIDNRLDDAALVCDRRQLGQAFTNIVKNAVEAVEAREGVAGKVSMTIAGDDAAVTLLVADNGVGLPAARDRLFEPYVTTRARGTGLGLAIVKKIVEEHFGTIVFADCEGGGTCVTMTFDRAALAAVETSDGVGDAPREFASNRT
jgi:two-component system nitrogen regulation sensor histidine kinase NtrY